MSKPRSKFVKNKETPKREIRSLVCNLVPTSCRFDTMEGREFLVVPMIILTEGVHNGSDGSIYYPSEELSKTPAVWNHKPVVVYHPEINGVGISACDPDVITNRKVGVMMNTKFDNGKLRSEAWIDKDRASIVDNRILEAVDRNEMMELSTGLFVDCEIVENGDWNGEPYSFIARNFRPDHLALLPDKIGACSIKDGAGFLRNESFEKSPELQELKKVLIKAGLLSNETSFGKIREELSSALRAKFESGKMEAYVYVEDVYSNFVVYELQGVLYRLGYFSSDAGVSLSDEAPVQVVRVVEYRTVQGAFVGNTDANKTKKADMNKEKLVNEIVANEKSVWAEKDREVLMNMTDEQLTSIGSALAEKPAVAEPAVVEPAATVVKNEGVAKPANVQDFIQQAPAEIQEVLRNSLSVYSEEKGKFIGVITANKRNVFKAEDLSRRTLGELKAIAALAQEEAPAAFVADYSGLGQVPTSNQGGEEAMALPTMNFAKA
jgi:hypothetical protein